MMPTRRVAIPSRCAHLHESGEYVEQADSLAESSADEFALTVDDIRSGRFPATMALSIVPPARGFASEGSLPDSLEAGSSESGTSAVGSSAASYRFAGAHLSGSRRVVPATAGAVEKAQEEKTLNEKVKPSVSGTQADTASVKSAPVKKTPGRDKQPSLKERLSCFSMCDVRCGYRLCDHDGGVERYRC